jgi:RNA polymerase sigma-70 factor (sigma-E family)
VKLTHRPDESEPARPLEVDLGDVFRAHHLELVRLATLLVGDQATAEDVVQDVFTRVHARWDRVAERDDALPYVRTSVINGCRSVHRRRKVASRAAGAPGPPSWPPLTVESAEQTALLAHDRRQVLLALASLPRRRREVLVLRYYLGLSEAEIASMLGIAAGTVKSTIARGLAALARKLGEDR